MNTRLARVRDFAVELRRRHVFRAAAFYAAAAFVALQLADIVFPALNLPDSATRLVLAIAILGFPLALILAWVYERGAEGGLVVTEKRSEAPELSPHLIAVVPFLVHGNRELGYLSEGIVDLLTSKLRCAGELRCVDPHALLSLQGRAADKSPRPGSRPLSGADPGGRALRLRQRRRGGWAPAHRRVDVPDGPGAGPRDTLLGGGAGVAAVRDHG